MPHKDKEERREYKRKWYLQHRDERKEYQKKYYSEHTEEKKESGKKYNLEHKEEKKEYNIKYSLEHKEEINVTRRKSVKIRYDNDPIYKRLTLIRNRFRKIIIKIITNGDITIENDIACLKLFGTTVDGLKKHIENQFTGTMSWYNHGRMYNPNKWQLDHIIPIGSFDFTIEENFTKAFHYTNTRPLMSSDHIEKSNKEKGKI